MHRKLALILTMLVTVIGSLSRAEAALALVPASATGIAQARTALLINS